MNCRSVGLSRVLGGSSKGLEPSARRRFPICEILLAELGLLLPIKRNRTPDEAVGVHRHDSGHLKRGRMSVQPMKSGKWREVA